MTYNSLDLSLLKHLISHKNHALDFVHGNDSKIFSPDSWNFANIIINYIKHYKDIPTLTILIEKSKNKKLTESIQNIWKELDKITVNEKEFVHTLEKVKIRYAEKQLLETKAIFDNLDLDSSIDINKTLGEMNRVIQSIKSLDNYKNYESKDIKEYLPSFVDKFNAKKENPELDNGLMTGYSFFDYATNGLRAADFVLIAGESGFGKSLFLQNMAIQVWLQKNVIKENSRLLGKNIIYFSLEMPYEDCFNRLLSRLSGVPSRNIENAKLSKEDFLKVKQCLDFIKEYPQQFKIVDIADANANDIELILTNSGDKFDAIFVDYLGIMRANEKIEEQDWLKQGIIAYELRAIARKYNIPIFSAVQLNRKTPGKGSMENIGLSRLARSGTIATHATHVLQIENRPNEENHSDFIYHVIKNRKGPKGKGLLIKNLACATLLDKNDGVPDNHYDDYFENQDDISEEIESLQL